ncbi:glycosyl hydrolase family 95 catalytic domain-containing protein [Streptomyces sp. NPDC089424]|uniref:glycosyl hydrolase family 95 catalytic domain-containing protein n=1 Tax=Streptomyces sp. NPDC089424 TaxID=3365917 RepID=UPI0037F45BA1
MGPRRLVRAALAAVSIIAVTAVGLSAPAAAAPTDAAFDSAPGALNVDRAAYLSKHDLVYNRPTTNPLHGLTVGNGRTGAMAWQSNGLTMQVSGVDTSQQTAFGAGLLNLSTTPALESGYSTFQQRLSLHDGTLTTKYDANRTVTVMGVPNSEVMGVHVEDTRPGVSAVNLDLGLWDTSQLGNSGDVPDLGTWKTVSTYADATGAGLSRGQADPQNFGYTLAATVEGTPYTARVVDGRTVRLSITPSSSYTIWFTASSRLNAPSHDSVAEAKRALASAKSRGYSTQLNAFKSWWHDFWGKSFVQYSGLSGDADYLENIYYLSTYMIAAGGYGTNPFHFINGVFRATRDETKWSNAYWFWNQRDVYNSFLASNHVDLLAGFNRLYSRNSAALKAYTRTRYDVDGLWVPETMGWDGNARGTVNSDFTNNIWSTGTEAAYNMYLQYAYTNDSAYLRNTAYPFMRDVVKFYAAKLSYDSASGKYFVASSHAHETYWNVPNAITDLAAVRTLFPLAISASQSLGLDADLRPQWQRIVDNLIAYPSTADVYLPHTPPLAQTRNGENVASEIIWPYDRTGIGYPDQQKAVNTFNARPFPYGNVWANDAVQAARLGLGDQAYQGMKTMLRKYQSYPNGMTDNTNGVFEYLGVHLAALNESLLQSYNDKIRVFPAAPSDASFVGRFTLLAKGGFTVSSEREAGEVKYIGLKSLYGKSTRVVNPWGSQELRVRDVTRGTTVLTTSATEFDLPTTAGNVYVVERTAKPLSSYGQVRLTGSANQGEKALSGTSSTLGMARTPNPMVNNTQLTYDANWHLTNGRGYGDYNDDTHHSTTPNAAASYTFTGTGVAYLSERNGDMGPVDVYLDGVLQATVDLRVSGPRQVQQTVWQRGGLTRGTHTLRIVNRSTSVGMVDALRITP